MQRGTFSVWDGVYGFFAACLYGVHIVRSRSMAEHLLYDLQGIAIHAHAFPFNTTFLNTILKAPDFSYSEQIGAAQHLWW